MNTIGITANYESYNHVLNAFSHSKNIEKAEEVFKLSKTNLKLLNKYLYNSLLVAFAKCQKVNETESIIR